MSAFDTGWLDLRESADQAARDRMLASVAIAYVESMDEPQIVDLGCGTGSTFRALNPQFSRSPHWRLIDHDASLIAAARKRIGPQARVIFETADLARLDTITLPFEGLVTASALFDLVSNDFVEHFAERLFEARLGLYAALNYDGTVRWEPELADDAAVLQAFNRHQTSDKGFGPALGPSAGAALAEALEGRGFRIATAQAPWRLGPDDAPLHDAFVSGMVEAVGETGEVDPARLTEWADRRREMIACHVGHLDLLALPG